MPLYNESEWGLLQQIRNASARAIDPTTWAVKQVSYEHAKIHHGDAYKAHDFVTLGDGGTREILVVTPDTLKWGHMIFSAYTALKGQAEVFEDAVQGYVAANALTAQNRNRNYEVSKPSGLLICHTPGYNSSSSSSGEEIEERIDGQAWGATGIGNNPGFGGQTRGTMEWVLKQDTTYLLRVTSQAATNVCSIALDWYEHTNKG